MIALVRAGVPLEQGLHDLAHDVPGELSRISETLAERMRRGESLEQALAHGPHQFPPVYRAVVEAGLQSGRLPSALESLATSVRRLAELRRMVALAMLYPLLVVLLTYGLFVLFVMAIAPVLAANDWTKTTARLTRPIAGLQSSVHLWGPILPLLLISAAAIWWYRSRRALLLHWPAANRYFGWFPTLRSVFANSRLAAFSEVLAMLIEHDVPLTRGLPLAGQSSGDPRLQRWADELARSIEQGQHSSRATADQQFAPLFAWSISQGRSRDELRRTAQLAARNYHARAQRQIDWLTLYFPLIVTAVIGGGVTFLYASSLFIPWSMMMRSIVAP